MKKRLLTVMGCLLVFLAFAGGGSVSAAQIDVQSKSALLMSADTGEVLFESNANERRPIASMVKIMTLLLCFDNVDSGRISLDDNVPVSERAAAMGGSQAFLDAGGSYKADKLIESIAIASANDSCVAMAEHISGSVENFVSDMNAKAEQLGMNDTVFVNCTGLPVAGQFSTARDVGKMFNQLIKHDGYFKYTKIWMSDFLHPSGRITGLTNTNKLIRQYNGCDAGKTGYTSEAKHCLAATAVRNDMRLISVIVGGPDSKTRFDENKKLFDYGFANYQAKHFIKKGDVAVAEVEVAGGKAKTVDAVAENNLTLFGKKGEQRGEVVFEIDEKVKAPLKKGDAIGRAYIKEGDAVLAETRLIAACDVEKANYFDTLKDITARW